MRIRALAAFSLGLALAAGGARASNIFTDDFESANTSKWTLWASTFQPLQISNAQNVVPSAGQYSAYAAVRSTRMHRNIIDDNGGAELGGPSTFGFWLYDSTLDMAYGEVRGYAGKGVPNGGTTADGSLVQLFAIGKYISTTMSGYTYDANKYQGRIVAGAKTGWFNLNTPRSPGWHHFAIERLADDTTVNFYVDDKLDTTFTGATASTWDTISLGYSGANDSKAGEAWYDGVQVTNTLVPEPGALGALALAAIGLLARRRA